MFAKEVEFRQIWLHCIQVLIYYPDLRHFNQFATDKSAPGSANLS